jgi:hypothetical protein
MEPPHRNAHDDQRVSRAQGGRKGGRIEGAELSLGFVQTPDEQKTPDVEITAIGGIEPVAMSVERPSRGVESFAGPMEIARDKRNLGLGDDAPRTRHRFLRTEGAGGPFYEILRACEIAELCHCDPAQRERRRVIAQRNALQGTERVTRRKRLSCGGDQGVHLNPATLVTPTLKLSGPNLPYDDQPASRVGNA